MASRPLTMSDQKPATSVDPGNKQPMPMIASGKVGVAAGSKGCLAKEEARPPVGAAAISYLYIIAGSGSRVSVAPDLPPGGEPVNVRDEQRIEARIRVLQVIHTALCLGCLTFFGLAL